jgi:hypothetical protein
MQFHPSFLVAWLVAAHGCSSAPHDTNADSAAAGEDTAAFEELEPGVICDGSMSMRLAVSQRADAMLQHAFPGELGWQYLYVRGDCKYWVLPLEPYGENGPVSDVREGTLTPEDEVALATALSYPRWDVLQGDYFQGGSDVPTWHFSDGSHTIGCRVSCGWAGDGRPAEIVRLQDAWNEWLPKLYAGALPYTGPMRMVVVYYDTPRDGVPECYEPWPFAWHPMDIAVYAPSNIDDPASEYMGQVGVGALVLDEPTISILRDSRHHYREEAEAFPGDLCNSYMGFAELRFHHEGVIYTVLSRDAIPFEDEQGLIRLP